jgi:hypothetical protein
MYGMRFDILRVQGRTMSYPRAYHDACAYLVAFGGYGPRPNQCRALVAQALRSIRLTHGRAFALRARSGMRFIAGHFPDKVAP